MVEWLEWLFDFEIKKKALAVSRGFFFDTI